MFAMLIFALNVACNKNDLRNTENDFSKLTIMDSLGRKIQFEQPPKRIVAFDSAAVEILFSIGAGDMIVGTHDFVSFPPEASLISKVGDAFNMNLESVIELNPDLVFVFSPTHVANLEKVGLKVLYLESRQSGLNEIPKDIRMWGNIVGHESKSVKISESFEDKTNLIQKRLKSTNKQLSVFQDVGGFWTPGNNTLMGEVFTLLNLSNIAFDIQGYDKISPETIVDRNPDIILTSDISIYTSDSKFSNLTAVTEGNIIEIDDDRLSIAGPRFIDGVTDIAKKIYPEILN